MRFYLGPDTAMPLASAIAAVIGVVVMFLRRVVAGVRSFATFVSGLVGRRTGRP